MTLPANPPRRVVRLPDAEPLRQHRSLERPPNQLVAVMEADRKDAPTVGIVGLGYVGLPTALALHDTGARVLGLEISEARISAILDCVVDLVDEDRRRLDDALVSDRFAVTSDARALAATDAIIVCVPTPVDRHLVPDLRALRAACATVVTNARAGQTIILTSTSYVGCTHDFVIAPLEARGLAVGFDIHVAFSPERIDPGNIAFPQASVPRVVGGAAPCCTARAAAVIGRVAPIHEVSTPEAAEFTKLYENAFRAINIAFANEMETAAGTLGVSFDEVLGAASTKPFGFMPFRAGIGVGGHCIPCDPHYLLWQLRGSRRQAPVLEQAMDAIAGRPGEMVRRAIDVLGELGVAIRNARVLIVGVTYKSGVDDIRESPAMEVIDGLRAHGAIVDYTDTRVPEITLKDGLTMRSLDRPELAATDLVLVNVIHPCVDYGWLDGRIVLDPSGRARDLLPRTRKDLAAVG